MNYQELASKLPLISTDRLNSFYDYTNHKLNFNDLSNYLGKQVVLGHKTKDGNVELFADVINISNGMITLSIKGTKPFIEIPTNEISYIYILNGTIVKVGIINQFCNLTNYDNNSITCYITEINDYEIELYVKTDNDIELSYYPSKLIMELNILD